MTTIGKYGKYVVSEEFEQKTMFPETKVRDENGHEETKRIMIRRVKRYLQLAHESGEIVCFAIYRHAGETRYKDSRQPKKSFATPDHCAGEVMRMLGVNESDAATLLSLYPETERNNAEHR